MSYLLDTGFAFAYINSADAFHESVSKTLDGIREKIVLPIPVVTEIAYLVRREMGVEALAGLLDEIGETDFVLEVPTPEDYKRSAEIIRKYDDANIDFVDALIVAIAERLLITKILTVDARHFRMFRPKHCAAFEILP